MVATPSLLLVLLLVAFPTTSSSSFDAALEDLQSRIGYRFRTPDLLRRAMTHASYSRENGRALAVLGLAASQSAAALRALADDRDAAARAVSRSAATAASESVCAATGSRVGIPAVVRVAAGTDASAAPVVCGALRALLGAVAVDANSSTDAAANVYWRVTATASASASASIM